MKNLKTNDWMIAISGLVFGILFYRQDIGINYSLFTLLQLIGLFLISEKEKRNVQWYISFFGGALAVVSVFLYGNLLSALSCFFSIIVLASQTIDNRTSVLISLFNGFLSYFTGIYHLATSLNERTSSTTPPIVETEAGTTTPTLDLNQEETQQPEEDSKQDKMFKTVVLFVASLGVAMVFFLLYRSANAQFKELTDKIDLSFISMSWIFFTLLGYYLIYFTYNQKNIKEIQKYDTETSNILEDKDDTKTKPLMSTGTELRWATMLFIMLNLLLLSVNFIDISYFAGWLKTATAETNLSANVHQGINAIITSIIFAVIIILYFFKGKLNFISNNKTLKKLAQFWILQNIVLVLFTALRNIQYVESFFLTYKRIGVFMYLIFCIIGLIYTFIKVQNVKSNWFLVRKVSWAIYAISILTPIINWDSFIINYNFNHAEKTPTQLDVNYLLTLNPVNYGLIFDRMEQSKNKNYYLSEVVGEHHKKDKFKKASRYYDWRSFNLRNHYAYIKYIDAMQYDDSPPKLAYSQNINR